MGVKLLITRNQLVVSIGLVLFIALILVLKIRHIGEINRMNESDESHTPSVQAVLDNTIRVIEAQSNNDAPSSVTHGIYISSEKSGSEQRGDLVSEDYSLIQFHGEMPVHTRSADYARPQESGFNDEVFARASDWVRSVEALDVLQRQGKQVERDWTFGWVLLNDNITIGEAEQSLAALEVNLLTFSGQLLRAKLPTHSQKLEQVIASPNVIAVGALNPESKYARDMFDQFVDDAMVRVPVFITLMTDDPTGRWKRELEDLGVVVGRFDSTLQTYTGVVETLKIDEITNTDYVIRVEPVRVITRAHDSAIPAMGVDGLRLMDDNGYLFNGITGENIPIGIADTGLNIRHQDIITGRSSICGANFQWRGRSPDEDLWIDEDLHGTHVTGTIVGSGSADSRFVGIAPGVQHIRFAKVLGSTGADEEDVIQGMDFLAKPTGCEKSAKVLPLIVNLSLAASSKYFEGRDTSARKTDSIV